MQSQDAHSHHRSPFWIWRCWGRAVCGRARSPRAGSRGWTVLRLQRTKTAKAFKPQKRKPLMRRCWGETGALVTMQGPPLTVFWKKKKEAWAGNMSFMNSCFPHTPLHSELLTASLKRRRRPLTCFHRFNVLQDDLHPTVEHLYGAVLGDEVLSNWWQRQGKAVFCELKLKEFIFTKVAACRV